MQQLSEDDIRMLAAMREGLVTHVAPELDSEMAQTMCNFSIGYIDKLIVKYSEWPDILRRQNVAQAKICKQIVELLDQAGAGESVPAEERDEINSLVSGQENASLTDLEHFQVRIDALLEKLAPLIMGSKKLAIEIPTEKLDRLLKELIASVQKSEKDVNQAIQLHQDQHAKLAGSTVIVSREKMQDYLQQRFGEKLEITAFRELPGGSSKSTILMDVKGFEGEGVTPLVARLDRIAGSTDTKVMDEVPTLKAMYSQGLPVPEVLWEEPDAGKIGLAFIGVRKADAKLGGDMWNVDKSLCDASTALDLARILAKLHNLDVAKLGLRGALNSDPSLHPMRGLIDNIRGLWRQKKMKPDGVLEACICWLEQNMPPAPEKLALIHADVSFHNIMVKDKKIACLLDWELSHLGDPNEDLSYCQPCIEQLLPWEEFMAEYRKHGGIEYSEEIGRFYGIWRGVRNAVYTITCGHSFHTDANPDFRWGFFASSYRVLLLEAADKVAQAGAFNESS